MLYMKLILYVLYFNALYTISSVITGINFIYFCEALFCTSLFICFFSFAFQHVLNLSFMEAAKGCHKNITARTQVVCDRCDGKRAEPGTSYSKCPTCKGTGEVSCLGQLVRCLRKWLCLLFLLQFYIGTFTLYCNLLSKRHQARQEPKELCYNG